MGWVFVWLGMGLLVWCWDVSWFVRYRFVFVVWGVGFCISARLGGWLFLI